MILNGRAMDPESKLDAVRNVGVKGGKIVAITGATITSRAIAEAFEASLQDLETLAADLAGDVSQGGRAAPQVARRLVGRVGHCAGDQLVEGPR